MVNESLTNGLFADLDPLETLLAIVLKWLVSDMDCRVKQKNGGSGTSESIRSLNRHWMLRRIRRDAEELRVTIFDTARNRELPKGYQTLRSSLAPIA
ncbi:hypothetical protein U1Q18_051730 [Sarracenia purpurea var. burkii]